ncbi:MAG: BON domain-containing protein [Legionella sp.]|nr:BON domain-containing protein [Legionella sp.]
MRKYVLNSLAAALFATVLIGCQKTPSIQSTDGVFHPFSNSTSQSLAQSVQDALSKNEEPQIAQVHVETNEKTVILSGYVKKIRQSDTAEQITHQIPGVAAVKNNIIVKP